MIFTKLCRKKLELFSKSFPSMRYSGIVPALAVLTPKIRFIIGPLFWPDSHRLRFNLFKWFLPSSARYYHFKLIELWYHNVDYVFAQLQKSTKLFDSALFYYFLDSSTISYSKSFFRQSRQKVFFCLAVERKKSTKKQLFYRVGKKEGPQKSRKRTYSWVYRQPGVFSAQASSCLSEITVVQWLSNSVIWRLLIRNTHNQWFFETVIRELPQRRLLCSVFSIQLSELFQTFNFFFQKFSSLYLCVKLCASVWGETGVGDWPLWNGLDEQSWLVRSKNDTFLLEKIFFQSFGFSDFSKTYGKCIFRDLYESVLKKKSILSNFWSSEF